MGGIDLELPFLQHLARFEDVQFVIAGHQNIKKASDNCLLLDQQSGFFHPDLINAADLVLCKAGYSTIAECYQASNAVVCVSRSIFPESKVLERFVTNKLHGTIIEPDYFLSGRWLDELEDLRNRKVEKRNVENGAEEVADFLVQLL